MDYPYLARGHSDDGGQYVVMFVENEKGVVLVNETHSENIYLGKIGLFDEDNFEPLPRGEYVRLNN